MSIVLSSAELLVAAAKVSGEMAFAKRREIGGVYRSLRRRIKYGHLKIVIFGVGGTGKTVLGEILDGKRRLGDVFSTEESEAIESYKRVGEGVYNVFVAPGETRFWGTEWPQLCNELAAGQCAGIINVVSYGYHTARKLEDYQQDRNYREGMKKEEFLQTYLHARQQRELEALDTITPFIKNAPVGKNAPGQKLWMITLVTKQDLWWKDRYDVERHYKEGKYNERIKELQLARGVDNFPHEYLSTSLVMSNFRFGQGEALASTTEGYDQNIQFGYWQNFLRKLNAHAGK